MLPVLQSPQEVGGGGGDGEVKKVDVLMNSLKLSDIMEMKEETELKLFQMYQNSSFYAVHMLMRYQKCQLTPSYTKPR